MPERTTIAFSGTGPSTGVPFSGSLSYLSDAEPLVEIPGSAQYDGLFARLEVGDDAFAGRDGTLTVGLDLAREAGARDILLLAAGFGPAGGADSAGFVLTLESPRADALPDARPPAAAELSGFAVDDDDIAITQPPARFIVARPDSLEFASEPALSRAEVETVALLYEAGLDRDGAVDALGLNFWVDQREAGLGERGLAAAFLESDEFQESAEAFLGDGTDLDDATVRDPAAFSNRDYVAFLYENVLDRPFDEAGLTFWLDSLEAFLADPAQAGTAREQLLLDFAASGENRAGADFLADLVEVGPGEWDIA
jgi:hypothetical protein